MTDRSLNLRITAIFIIFVASIIGVVFPFYILYRYGLADNKESPLFKCMKTGAAGVMLGIALMHLLADANTALSQVVDQYNLAYAMTCVGVVVNLTIEQCALVFIDMQSAARKLTTAGIRPNDAINKHEGRTSPSKWNTSCSSLQTRHELVHTESCGLASCEHLDGVKIVNLNPEASSLGFDCDPGGMIDQDINTRLDMSADSELISGLMVSSELKDMILLYSLEISISVHSVIIGFDIGLLNGSGSLETLTTLICAISFHQLMEGVGLGTNILSSKNSLGNAKLIAFIIVFASTCPMGIIIGICTASSKESNGQLYAQGIANSMAAGSLLYISLAEMVSSYFSSANLTNRPTIKLLMIASFSLGVAIMAVLAYWA